MKKYNYKIYSLVDPRKPDNIRYVGITRRSIWKRRKEHIKNSNRIKNRYKSKWIRSLGKVQPKIQILEQLKCTEEQAKLVEDSYIKAYLALGHKLTNSLAINIGSTLNTGKADRTQKIIVLHRKTGKLYKTFKSSKQAAKELNLSAGFIANCISGKKVGSSKYVFVKSKNYNLTKNYSVAEFDRKQFSRNQMKFKKDKMISAMVNSVATPFYQLDKNHNIIKKWLTQSECARKLGLQQSNIYKVLHKKRKTTGGFVFMYIKDYEDIV